MWNNQTLLKSGKVWIGASIEKKLVCHKFFILNVHKVVEYPWPVFTIVSELKGIGSIAAELRIKFVKSKPVQELGEGQFLLGKGGK